MKKSLIITIGAILILIVLGVWLYLLIFGTPQNTDDIFANLGFGSPSTQITPTVTPEILDDGNIGDTPQALRQLTTAPVAGFSFVPSETDSIRYVERGTGHIFEINISSGEERKVSGTTIPKVVEAVFSESATSVALVVEDGYQRQVYAGTIVDPESSIDFIVLPVGASNPAFMNDSQLRYTLTTTIGTDGYEIDLTTGSSIRVFSIPLTDVQVLWGDETYVYNSPTALFPGILYRVQSTLTPVTGGSFGFVGGVSEKYFFESRNENGRRVSSALDQTSGETTALAVSYIPEKCTVVETDPELLWCASPFNSLSDAFLENWYKGIQQSEDALWYVNVAGGEAQLRSNFTNESGRIVDVDKIAVEGTGLTPIFRNKIDGTLWLYDSRVQ